MKYEIKVKSETVNFIAEMVNHEDVVILVADLKTKRPEVIEMSSSDDWHTFFIEGNGEISVKAKAVTIRETGRYTLTIVLANYSTWDDEQKIVWDGAK